MCVEATFVVFIQIIFIRVPTLINDMHGDETVAFIQKSRNIKLIGSE